MAKRIYVTTGINYININQPMELLFSKYQQKGDLLNNETWRLGYGLSLGYMSFIGPISLSTSMDHRRQKVITNFAFGFHF